MWLQNPAATRKRALLGEVETSIVAGVPVGRR